MDSVIEAWGATATAQDGFDAKAWLALAGKAIDAGGAMPLDPRDPVQGAHIAAWLGDDSHLAMHFPRKAAMIGATAQMYERYGALPGRTLLEMKPAQTRTSGLQPYVGIAHFGLHPGADAVVATGIVSHPQTLQALETTLAIVDADTGEVVGTTSIPPQFNTSYQRATVTAPLSPGDKPRNLVAAMTSNYVVDGQPFATPMLAAAQLSTVAAIAVVTPFAPLPIKHPGAQVVKIGIDRNDGDLDYSFMNITPTTEVMVPFSGEAQLASGYLMAQPACPSGSLILIAKDGPKPGAQYALAQSDVMAAFDGSQGQVATWSMGPDWQQVFTVDGPGTFDVLLQVTLNVTAGGVPNTTQLTVGSVGPVSSGGSLFPLYIQWGCVAPWTAVRMADGSERAIDRVVVGDRLAAEDGRVVEVERVIDGTETAPMWRLRAGGRSLLATHDHPVMTPGGARPIRSLRAGEAISTASGTAPIELNVAEPYDGAVVNLVLRSPDGSVPIRGDCFVAEGMLIGDNTMQAAMGQASAPRAIPEDWRLDAVNAERLAAGATLIAC